MTRADVFAFLTAQRAPRRGETVVRLEDGEPGLAARTIARRLSTVPGLFACLAAREDSGVRANPVPAGWPAAILDAVAGAGCRWCAPRASWPRRRQTRCWQRCARPATGPWCWQCCSAGCAAAKCGPLVVQVVAHPAAPGAALGPVRARLGDLRLRCPDRSCDRARLNQGRM